MLLITIGVSETVFWDMEEVVRIQHDLRAGGLFCKPIIRETAQNTVLIMEWLGGAPEGEAGPVCAPKVFQAPLWVFDVC